MLASSGSPNLTFELEIHYYDAQKVMHQPVGRSVWMFHFKFPFFYFAFQEEWCVHVWLLPWHQVLRPVGHPHLLTPPGGPTDEAINVGRWSPFGKIVLIIQSGHPLIKLFRILWFCAILMVLWDVDSKVQWWPFCALVVASEVIRSNVLQLFSYDTKLTLVTEK